tara:strand:+ start:193 stop:594 length:402 start_codon:yes stop_codon:yes gene_type:complete
MIKFKDYSFECPHCHHQLSNHDGKVIFQTRYGDQMEKQGTIFLSPVIGDYKYRHEPDFNFAKGTLVQFECPKCSKDLTSTKNSDFVYIVMKVTPEIQFDVYFSRKAGSHKTYVVTENGPETYGESNERIEELH